jgi:hypothetical protein
MRERLMRRGLNQGPPRDILSRISLRFIQATPSQCIPLRTRRPKRRDDRTWDRAWGCMDAGLRDMPTTDFRFSIEGRR